MQEVLNEMRAKLKTISIENLFAMLDQLSATERGSDEWVVRNWIRVEVESRYDVDAAMNEWAMDTECTLTYDEALRRAVEVAA